MSILYFDPKDGLNSNSGDINSPKNFLYQSTGSTSYNNVELRIKMSDILFNLDDTSKYHLSPDKNNNLMNLTTNDTNKINEILGSDLVGKYFGNCKILRVDRINNNKIAFKFRDMGYFDYSNLNILDPIVVNAPVNTQIINCSGNVSIKGGWDFDTNTQKGVTILEYSGNAIQPHNHNPYPSCLLFENTYNSNVSISNLIMTDFVNGIRCVRDNNCGLVVENCSFLGIWGSPIVFRGVVKNSRVTDCKFISSGLIKSYLFLNRTEIGYFGVSKGNIFENCIIHKFTIPLLDNFNSFNNCTFSEINTNVLFVSDYYKDMTKFNDCEFDNLSNSILNGNIKISKMNKISTINKTIVEEGVIESHPQIREGSVSWILKPRLNKNLYFKVAELPIRDIKNYNLTIITVPSNNNGLRAEIIYEDELIGQGTETNGQIVLTKLNNINSISNLDAIGYVFVIGEGKSVNDSYTIFDFILEGE